MSDECALGLAVVLALGLLALITFGSPPRPCPPPIVIESPATSDR